MKKILPAIAILGAVIISGIIIFTIPNDFQNNIDPDDPDGDDNIRQYHDYVWSGPIGVTQYEHRLGENVYFVIRGLQSHEVGTIGVFTPEGILYKTIPYDGSKKSNFNQFFFPDTFVEYDICTPKQLVGVWKVVFADNSYPPLEFVMTDEWLPGGGSRSNCSVLIIVLDYCENNFFHQYDMQDLMGLLSKSLRQNHNQLKFL